MCPPAVMHKAGPSEPLDLPQGPACSCLVNSSPFSVSFLGNSWSRQGFQLQLGMCTHSLCEPLPCDTFPLPRNSTCNNLLPLPRRQVWPLGTLASRNSSLLEDRWPNLSTLKLPELAAVTTTESPPAHVTSSLGAPVP